MDQKSNPGEKSLANHILSNVTEANYIKVIRRYQSDLFYRSSLHNISLATEEIRQGLELLIKTCNKLEEHQIIWANYVKYFPNNFMPPLKVPSNFRVADLNDNFKVKILQIHVQFLRVSNYLYKKKNIPELKKETQVFFTRGSFGFISGFLFTKATFRIINNPYKTFLE
jgi:hypothetical protein